MHTAVTHFRWFVHEHDDIPAFHAGYMVLALLSAGLFNLGAFGLIIVAHMSMDVVKYREYHGYSWKSTWEGVMRESLADVTLLVVGLVFAVYLHHSVGVATVSGLMRAELGIIRTIAMFVPKIKILHHFLKVVAHLRHYMDSIHPRMDEGLSGLDHLCFYFIGMSLFLLLFAAPIMDIEWSLVQMILLEELIPWRL